MSTHCRVIQLLEPDAPSNLTIDDDDSSLAIEEGGVLALVNGVTEYTVPFIGTKVNGSYDFIEADVIVAPGGEGDLILEASMQNRTTTQFDLVLDAAPDGADYRFNWRVRCATV